MQMFRNLFGGGQYDIQSTEAQARLQSVQAPYVLDVRTPGEYRQGHIDGAVLIPLDELDRRIQEVPADREILVVCRSGARSGIATSQLRAAGYNAFNLSGGIMSWMRSGLPMSRK
ncbi:MAG: rhodanese-like domain-containing protein [Anaerolineae bacterium]|nr:rhodanese-like domain-containing protein [Anaerolineae bacterium]